MGSDWVAESKLPCPTLTVRSQCPHLHSQGGAGDQGFSNLFLSHGRFVQAKPEVEREPGRWMKSMAGRGLHSHQRGSEAEPCGEPTADPEPGRQQRKSPAPGTGPWGGPARGAGGSHTSSRAGFSELLSRDSRFRAETPGTWPAQICSMRTRRWATVARKPSTCRGRAEDRGEANRARAAAQAAKGGPGSDTTAHHGQAPVRSTPHPAASNCSGLQSLQTPSRDTTGDGPSSRGNKA